MRFLALFLAALAALALAYAGALRQVDPHGEFGTGLFPVVELDARAEKMRLFRAYRATAAPEGLILGSSRAMKLSPRRLESATGRRFFNFAVDNARAEDDLAIYRWVRQQGVAVRLLVIGLDVEALHDDDRPEPGLVRNDALSQALPLAAVPQVSLVRRLKRGKSTFTIEYLAHAVRAVRLSVPSSRPAVPLMEFEPDGYLRYRRWEQERAAGTFRLDADRERCLAKYRGRFEGMGGLSGRRRAWLQQLVQEARADGARIVLWLTCLHPLTARYLETHTAYAALGAAAAAYQDSMTGDRVTAYDFSRPESYGGTADGWYDCAHVDEANADRIGAALARGLR